MRHLYALAKLLSCLFPIMFISTTFAAGGQQAQTINVVPIQDQTYGVAPFQVIALASTGLPVTLSVSGPATLNGRLLTITGTGTVTITAQQSGNQDYAPASAQTSFQVKQGAPAVQWSPGSIIYGTPLDSAILNASATAIPGFDPAADVPTITTQTGTSQLNGGSTPNYLWSDSAFRYEGPPMVQSGGGNAPDTTITTVHSYRVAFTCDCKQFEFVLRNGGGHYNLWVDGNWLSSVASDQISSSQMGFYRVQFPDKRSRQIKIAIIGRQPFYGVVTSSDDTISVPEVPINTIGKVVVFGDSWATPTVIDPATGTGIYGTGYGQILSEFFNWDFYESGEGGSGFVNPGAYWPNEDFVQREQTDVCHAGPAVVIVEGGVNDRFYSESSIQQNVTQFLTQLQNCLPNAQVFLVGPQINTSGGSIADVETAFASAAAQFSNIHFVDPVAANWLYGDSNDPSTGNEYLYFNATGGHPTPLGHDYFAEKIASYLISTVPSLAPQTYPLFTPAPIPGTYTYSVTSGTLLPAGQHQVSVTFTPQDSTNYAAVTQNATITVVKASSSIAVSASSGSVAPGKTLTFTAKVSPQIGGTPTGTVTFFDNGNPAGTAPLDTSGNASFTASWTVAGTHQISASYSGDGNFWGSSTSSALPITVAKPDFIMSVNATQVTVVPGQSATLTLTVTPVAGLAANLNLSCTGLPANVVCSLKDAQQITINNQQSATATVVIQAFSPNATNSGLLKFGEGVEMCGLFAVFFVLRRRNRKAIASLVGSIILLIAGASFISGCGSGSKIKTPEPGTYNVNVTLTSASDATLTHSQAVTVIIP